MALTIILICLVVQRWFHFDSYTRRYDWFDHYYRWFKHRFDHRGFWSGWGGFFITVLPGLIIYMLVASLVCHVIGLIAYYLLSLVVLWYCLDARRLTVESAGGSSARQLLGMTVQNIFALIFWLLVFGSVGVVLYTLVVSLRKTLESEEDEKSKSLYAVAAKAEGILDWIPIRLMGITYALVGHFSPTFKCWYENLWTGIYYTREQAAGCGLIAMGMDDAPGPLSEDQLGDIDGLVNRSLLVWLVVIALFTIGAWIG